MNVDENVLLHIVGLDRDVHSTECLLVITFIINTVVLFVTQWPHLSFIMILYRPSDNIQNQERNLSRMIVI